MVPKYEYAHQLMSEIICMAYVNYATKIEVKTTKSWVVESFLEKEGS